MDSVFFKSSRCILADKAPLEVGKTDQGNPLRKMQILRTGTFTDPRYGTFPITPKMLNEMVKNFSEGVRGVIPSLDYKHESDDIAAGWFHKLYTKQDGSDLELWAEIEMTPRGEKTLSDKEFGYISADFDSDYCDNEKGTKHGCVLLGAGLTNRPVIKRMESVIELSEKPYQFAADKTDPVSEKIKKLIKEGKPQDQAVAIALEMQRTGKLSEKVLANENLANENQSKGKNKMDDLTKMSPEELIAMIKDLQAKLAAAPKPEMEMELKSEQEKGTKLSAELAEANAKIAEFEKQKCLAEKTSQFVKMLSEGKAVEAQREAFMGGDMMKFAELAQPINPKANGSNGDQTQFADAQEEVIETAKKLSEEKKISMKDAISEVLSTNKLLAEKVRK